MPRVTVCIAVHNGADTLATSLDSVFAQSYKDFNVLVLDDGSKDNSAEVASRYPVKLIRQENQGLGAARKRMVDEADGELIGFNDHDDVWMPDKLELQVPLHDNSDVVMSYTGGEWVQLDGKKLVRNETAPGGSLSFDHLIPKNYVIGISTLFRKQDMLRAGNFASDVKVGSDVYGWFQLARFGKFAFVPKPLVRYYSRPGQNTEPGYRFFEHDRYLYEEKLLKRFDELFEGAPEARKRYYRRCLVQNIARIRRALAHFARTEKKDYRLAMGHHWRSVLTDPGRLDYWGSFLKNALVWRTP